VTGRVALLGGGAPLADALAARGLDVMGRELRVPAGVARVLRARGFRPELAEAWLARRAVRALRPDVVHAFSAEAAFGALRAGARVVFSSADVLDRGALADHRRRLEVLTAAVEQSAAVVVADEQAAAAMRRWLAVEPIVLDPADAAGHEALYARLR